MIVASCVKFKPKGFDYWQYLTSISHENIYNTLLSLGISLQEAEVIEGFMTDEDQFVNRHEATFVAKRCNQVPSYFDSFYLDSEDIWPEDSVDCK